MFQKPTDEYKQQHASHQASDSVETVVGPSVQVEGDFVSEGNIIVKGVVSGSVRTSQLLRVEEGAKILANVKAGTAVISGQIKGNIKAASSIELTASAQVLGDITCHTLAVEPGALIHGKVSMKGLNDSEDDKPKRRTRKRVTEDEGETTEEA